MYNNFYEVKDGEKFLQNKKTLTTVEKYGLEAILLEFLLSQESCCEATRDELADVLTYGEKVVVVMDGYSDVIQIDGELLLHNVFINEFGVVCATCRRIPEGCEDWTELDVDALERVVGVLG